MVSLLDKLFLNTDLSLIPDTKIYLIEVDIPLNSIKINCEYKKKNPKWYNFLDDNEKITANYRLFKGENDFFSVEYTFLDIPNKDDYYTLLSPYVNMNPSTFDLCLNQIEISIKNLFLSDDAYSNYISLFKHEHDLINNIYDLKRIYEKPSQNVSLTYLGTAYSQKYLFPIDESKNHFRVFSRLGLDNADEYISFINNYSEFKTKFSIDPVENLIEIKKYLYRLILNNVIGMISTKDGGGVQIKLNNFLSSYLNNGISNSENYFKSFSFFDEYLWEKNYFQNRLDIFRNQTQQKYTSKKNNGCGEKKNSNKKRKKKQLVHIKKFNKKKLKINNKRK